MTQHTPGPWVYGQDGFIPGTFWVGRDYGKIVCRVVAEEAAANAKLIAAAPDLLVNLIIAIATLRASWPNSEEEFEEQRVIKKLRAAIAKATI